MVSFHTPLSPTRKKIIPELQNLLKKRKRDDDHEADDDDDDDDDQEIYSNKALMKAKTINFGIDSELHLQTPLPLEWQRCLDVKSGQIYYYNTKTNKRTSIDPRLSQQESSSHSHMGLDLELNLPCGNSLVNDNFSKENSTKISKNGEFKRSPSWLAFDGDQQEMVTAVCKKCHMLVMMCKSSPSCPNCKFMHPLNHSDDAPKQFNQRLSLFC